MKRRRDKKLDYLFLIGYVALIYGMLSFTPAITKLMESRNPVLFGIITAIAVALSIVLVLMIFRRRLKGKSPAVYAGIAAALLAYAFILLFCTPIAVEKLHFIEYGVMSYLVLRVVRDVRPRNIRYLYIGLTVALIGIGDELLQKAIPIRVCDVRDMAMNALAGLLALILLILLGEA